MLSIFRELRLPGAPRWFWLLLAVTATAPFWSLGHPLIEVDDARYAEVPREMALGGDWATPHLNDLDYVEKPPLWYWLCAASYRVFGVSEAAARLPLALSALAGLLGAAWLGSWLYGARVGWTAAAAMGTSGLYFLLSHYITPDLGLTVWLLWCSAFFLRALSRPEDATWAGPAAWACAGLAFLSKGLVGAVFPALWAAVLWLLLPEARSRFRSLLRPAGPALFLLIVSPWFILMERRHPGFLRFFFYEHHVQRYLTQKFDRASPWYFFLLVLPAGLLPWTPAVLAGLSRAWSDWRTSKDGRGLALAAWAALITAFFSCSQSKLVTYILPAFPHLCILAALSLEERAAPWLRRAAASTAVLLLLAAAAAVPAARLIAADQIPSPLVPFLMAAALAATGAALLCWSRGIRPLIAASAAGLLVGGLALAGLRTAAGALSCRELAAAISSRQRPGDLLYSYGTYLHGLPFYTGRRVDRMINWWGELDYAYRDSRIRTERSGGQDLIQSLPLEGKRVFVVCRRRDAPWVLSLNPRRSGRPARSFGRWFLIEY